MLNPKNLVGTTIDGRYQLLDHLGHGSYGNVYEASQQALGQHVARVAVKLVYPESDEERTALLKEIQGLARLNHPNILRFLNAGEETTGLLSGTVYIVTELAEKCLEKVQRESTCLPEAVVREVAVAVAAALDYIHSQGAIHRDVKPGNVMQVDGAWKLADFGMVRAVSGSLVTASGEKGTLGYLAPEQLDGQVGPASDIYSLGVTLLQCLTGRLAHEGSTRETFLRNLMSQPPSIPADLGEPWHSAIERCLRRDPRERCSAGELPVLLSGTASPSPSPVAQALVNRVHAPAAPAAPKPAQPAGAVRPVAARLWEREGSRVGEEIEGPDGAVYVWVPPGEFMMGSTKEEADFAIKVLRARPEWVKREQPAHRVRITRGFWLGKHPVTNRDYFEFCAATGGVFPGGSDQGDDHPVVCVTWDDATAYCKHHGLSLPTEAEWEWAARGVDGCRYPWGDEWDVRQCCNADNKGPGGRTFSVGSFPSGVSWCGAHDMAGNVWEWCADWYGRDYYAQSPRADPAGPPSGRSRVLRGGSWLDLAYGCRSAFRDWSDPVNRLNNNGFRPLVRPR